MSVVSRRTLLTTTAATAAAAALPLRVDAAAPAAGRQAAGIYRYKIGEFELTAINDGVWNRAIDDKFVRNAPFPDVQRAMQSAFMPAGILPIPFTSLAVNTGSKLVLLDTGTGGQLRQMAPQSGTWNDNLAAAGIDPKAVDAVLISHFHPDHINGIKTKEGQVMFPNAEIMVSAPEWAFWMDDGRMGTAPDAIRPSFLNSRRIFGDIAGKVTRFEPGKELVPGITSIAAFGHTPGHTAFAIASAGKSMLVLSDSTNNPYLFVRNPNWHAAFDMDGAMAAENRKRLLDRAAADRMLVQGYHFPFPASGYIVKQGAGYDLVPAMWQSAL